MYNGYKCCSALFGFVAKEKTKRIIVGECGATLQCSKWDIYKVFWKMECKMAILGNISDKMSFQELNLKKETK